jgi:hypothetical protein
MSFLVLLLGFVVICNCCSFKKNLFLAANKQPQSFKEPVNPCAICLEELELQTEFKANDLEEPIAFHKQRISLPWQPTNHYFHRKCLENYQKQQNSNCPMCRQPVNRESAGEYLYFFCWTEACPLKMSLFNGLIGFLNKTSKEGLVKALNVCISMQRWNRISHVTSFFGNGLIKEKENLIRELLYSIVDEVKSLEFDLAYVQTIPSVTEGVEFLMTRNSFFDRKQAFEKIISMQFEWKNIYHRTGESKELGRFFVDFAWNEYQREPFERATFLSFSNLFLIRELLESEMKRCEKKLFTEGLLNYFYSTGEFDFFHLHVKQLIPRDCTKSWHIEERGAFCLKPREPSPIEGELAEISNNE